MMINLLLVAIFGLVVSTFAADELKVTIYEGPKECETPVKAGDYLSMHYTGTIDASSKTGTPGKQFDSSRGRGQTFDFAIGTGQVITGWDEGLIGLCVGAKATLVIPPEMGYGSRGAGADIPGGATLNFDVEVIKIGEAPPQPNLFLEIDGHGEDGVEDGLISPDELGSWFMVERGQEAPSAIMEEEDTDGDGFISWEEFSGPKGVAAPTQKGEL